MCEERVIETLLAAIARRDETIRENVAALRAAVQREERDHEEVADLRERIEDFRKRLAVCCEESENRRRQLHENATERDTLLDQISKERLARGLAFALAIAEYRAAEPTLVSFVATQREWSSRTFGEGMRTLGIVKHVEKELKEIKSAHPGSRGQLEEWIDVALLALDGAWRTGAPPHLVVEMLLDKAKRNRERQWPDPSTLSQDEPSEHVKYVRVDRYTCPECLEPSGRCSRQCDACHAQSSDYCTAPNCIRNPGHTGPCRGFA